VFSWSYQLLPADAARAFRLLGLHPGPDLAPPALAALCELSLPEAQRVLGLLSRAHLVEQRVAGRYGLHRLLDDYAHELATSTDSDRDRWTAQTRLFDYYLHTAARAMDLLFPTRSHHRPQLPPGSVETDWLTDLATARRWLDAERANLVAIAIQAGRKGWPWHTIRLAQTIAHYLNSAAHHREALTLHRSARSAAQACEDQRGEAASLNDLGTAAARLGLPEAIGSFQRALALYLELGDRPGQGRVLGNLGHVYRRLGRHAEALEHYRRHLEMHRAIGDLVEQATALNSLGALHFSLGNHAESLRHYEQALTICRDNGDIEGQARTLGNLAETYLHLGNYGQARSSQQLALQKYQQAGDHGRAAATLAELEGTAERQARDTAARNLQQAAGD
jgi:tetratricopeptide (TPR) repeat protein